MNSSYLLQQIHIISMKCKIQQKFLACFSGRIIVQNLNSITKENFPKLKALNERNQNLVEKVNITENGKSFRDHSLGNSSTETSQAMNTRR